MKNPVTKDDKIIILELLLKELGKTALLAVVAAVIGALAYSIYVNLFSMLKCDPIGLETGIVCAVIIFFVFIS